MSKRYTWSDLNCCLTFMPLVYLTPWEQKRKSLRLFQSLSSSRLLFLLYYPYNIRLTVFGWMEVKRHDSKIVNITIYHKFCCIWIKYTNTSGYSDQSASTLLAAHPFYEHDWKQAFEIKGKKQRMWWANGLCRYVCSMSRQIRIYLWKPNISFFLFILWYPCL